MRKGKGLVEAITLAQQVDSDMIQVAITSAPTSALVDAVQQFNTVAGLGDGSIIAKVLEFLNSDLGKALIALLVSLILAA